MKQTVKCCYGISSKVNDFDHVFMIDYDHIELKDVLQHVTLIQKEYNLSDMYIIKSTNGFNVISLDMIHPSLIYNIGVDVHSPADRNFFKYGFKRGYYVLRFDKDKELVGIVTNKCQVYEKSLAHKKFLEWFFSILIHDDNFNEEDKIDIIQYPSNKDGFHLVDREIPPYLVTGV